MSLDPEHWEALRRLGDREDRSVSWLVRRGVDLVLAEFAEGSPASAELAEQRERDREAIRVGLAQAEEAVAGKSDDELRAILKEQEEGHRARKRAASQVCEHSFRAGASGLTVCSKCGEVKK